jgi:hypothetical protein
VRSVVYKAFIKSQIQCDGTRYFARQLLNKHAKNYENVEKITKFLLSTKVGLKINKTSQQNKISKTLSITETMFLPYFLSHLYFLIAIVQNTNMASHLWFYAPRSRARNQHRSVVISTIPSIQLDSLGQQLAIGMYSFADMDLQLFSLNF